MSDWTREKVSERLRKIVSEQLGVDESKITEETNFVEDLNADSLDLVELIMALEEEFSKEGQILEISDVDAEKITTFKEAVDFILEHLKD